MSTSHLHNQAGTAQVSGRISKQTKITTNTDHNESQQHVKWNGNAKFTFQNRNCLPETYGLESAMAISIAKLDKVAVVYTKR